MKKIFLYLFFVIVLFSSVSALWSIEDTLINVDSFLTQFYWTGNKIKFVGGDVNKVNVIKYGSTSANICAVFNTSSFSYLSENFSFVGNNCSITYNFLNDTEYIIALYRDDSYTFNEYYYTPISSPLITTNMLWYGYITNNIENNWSFAEEFIVDFTKLEINLSIPEIPANITPTQNETITENNFDIISESMNFGIFWFVILFAWLFPFIILGIFRNKSLMDQGSVVSMVIFAIMVFYIYQFKYLSGSLKFFLSLFCLFGIIFFALVINEEIKLFEKRD